MQDPRAALEPHARRRTGYAAVLSALLAAGPCLGQSAGPTPAASLPARVAGDAKAYVTAPLRARRAQWVRFGAAMGAIAVAYQLDDDVREHFDTPLAPSGVTPDTKDTEHAAPAALMLGGTWLAAAVLDDDDGRREAGSMLEAAAFSVVASAAIKEIADRDRPYATLDRGAFGESGDAFPSMHTAAAFSIGTVFAESGSDRHRWLRRTLGYGIAAWTAYARMEEGAHWFSDTVAGAAIGVATARFVLNRRGAESGGALRLTPTSHGVEIHYTVALD